jgi:hypothetical protein
MIAYSQCYQIGTINEEGKVDKIDKHLDTYISKCANIKIDSLTQEQDVPETTSNSIGNSTMTTEAESSERTEESSAGNTDENQSTDEDP